MIESLLLSWKFLCQLFQDVRIVKPNEVFYLHMELLFNENWTHKVNYKTIYETSLHLLEYKYGLTVISLSISLYFFSDCC